MRILFNWFFSIILIIIGIGIIYWISRRKFNRRNDAGIEGFSNFEKSVLIRFIERVGKWIAYALIIVVFFLSGPIRS